MRARRIFTAALLASAFAQAEPLSPRVAERYRQMLAANPAEGIALDRLWKGAIDGGTTEELLAAYAKAEDFSGRMIFGLLLRKAGRDDEARAAFESAGKADSANPLPALALGRMETERGRSREAAEFFAKALAILPKDDVRAQDALMQLGAAWSVVGEPAKAAAAWERMVAVAPEDLEVRRRLAQACADAAQPDIAIRHLEFLATHAEPSERAKALQQIASLHSAAGRTDDAMQALERAVRGTAPGNWLRAELLGQIIRLAQRTHAENALEKKWLAQAESNPRDLGGYLQLVEFYGRTGNPERERVWLEKITSLAPGNSDYALRLARLLAQMDQLDAAAARFDKVIAAQPRNTDLVFERARLDLRLDDGASARRRIEAMLAAHRDDELLSAAALGFFQEHRMLDSVEEHLRADAQAGGEDALIALAEFYFSQRKNDDARSTLARLLRSGDAPAEAARRHALVAEHLKGQGEISAAVAETEAAVRFTPDSREALMLLGELRAALAQHSEAKAAYVRAYAASRSDAERNEVDGKLFESIRASAVPLIAGRAQGESAAALVEGFIRDLMREANDAKSPVGWLRVARWKAWNGDRASAVTFAAKAADMEPKNPAAREFLARHAAANGEPAYAVAYLRELIEINPAGRDGYLREIAQLELQRGDHAEALQIFAQLVKSNPGSTDALADLGNAQERADRTQEAAATWRKVLALAPAPRQREALASLLRVLEKTGAHAEATELLLRGADEAGDERTRFARLDELLLYCQRHGRLPWVRGVFEKRRATKADDWSAAIVLGRVLKLMGKKAEAFEIFADAALSTPSAAEVLPELVREAEELRRPALAVRLQEQFVRSAKVEQPDGWLRLAILQEGSGDLNGAERTWTQAVAKFPRDPDVLRRAADFHQQWGDRRIATALLGKICALDALDARAASELGELHFSAGKFAEARAAFESVMKLTQPVTQLLYPTERGEYPWGQWNATHSLRGVPAPFANPTRRLEGEAQIRLGALRRLGEIARNTGGAALEKWIADWRSAASGEATETLWALYFSGARDAVLSLAEKNAAMGTERNLHRQAFIWMACESGLFARLGTWLNADGRTAEDVELFSVAFAEMLRSRPELMSSAMMRGLFPEGARVQLWPYAVELARAKHMREAIALGRRVFEEAPSDRGWIGGELARWHLALGEMEEAIKVLTAACKGYGESFDSMRYSVLRDLYFLLPKDRRAAFVEEQLHEAGGETVDGLQTRALLFALEGRMEEARSALTCLLARHPLGVVSEEKSNPVLREWNYVKTAADQFIRWNQRELARHVLDTALADDAVCVLHEQQHVRNPVGETKGTGGEWSEQPLLRYMILDLRVQRDALAYLAGGVVERKAMLARLQRPSEDNVRSRFSNELERLGGRAHQAEIWKARWEFSQGGDYNALNSLFGVLMNAGDVATDEAVRRKCVEENIGLAGRTSSGFSLELAELLEARGAKDEACEAITKALAQNPEEPWLMFRGALLLERCGRMESAVKLWEKIIHSETGSPTARIEIASVLERRGKFAEAIEVRNRTGPSGDTALPELFCKNGQTDEALLALERLAGNGAVQAAMAAAEVLGLKGEGATARSVLIAAASKTTEPRTLLQARAELLTIPGFPPSREFLVRMQERMRDAVREHPELAGAYFEFFEHYAGRFGIEEEWKNEVATAWADGKGDVLAGMVMFRRKCARGDASAKRMCETLLGRADLSDVSLEVLGNFAHEIRRADLQLLVAESIACRSWPSADGMLEHVRLLAANGSREHAAEVLAQHAWLEGFSGGAETLGRAWLDLGDAVQARAFLSRAMKESLPSPSPSMLAAMAQAHVAANNFAAARLLLRRAFAEPVCHEYAVLAAYLEAGGELARWTEVAAEFGLAARARHELQLAIFALHEKRGRVREVLALVAARPSIVSPVGEFRGDGALLPVDCARLRRLAEKTGEFEQVEEALEWMAASQMPDAAGELEALHADAAERSGNRDDAMLHFERAAELRPASWEFARRAAEIRLGRGEPANAKAALERFLSVSQSRGEREAALDFWEKADRAAKQGKG
jgi:tetratricopeptide (TPR) repeat protein